jgi:hypothetical protein
MTLSCKRLIKKSYFRKCDRLIFQHLFHHKKKLKMKYDLRKTIYKSSFIKKGNFNFAENPLFSVLIVIAIL